MTALDTSPAAIAAMLEGVTPGPWTPHRDPGHFDTLSDVRGGAKREAQGISSQVMLSVGGFAEWKEQEANTRFIAAARDIVPALAAERDRLSAQVVQLQRDLDAANVRAERAEAGPKVKPLVWCHHPMGAIASPPTGQAYIIDVRIKGRVMFIKGMNPPPQFDNLEAAKAAAQADYEARILSALEKPHD